MMGGSLSHEFMLLTPIGEDSIVLCDDCGYKANMEAAENISDIPRAAESAELEKVHTPNIHTIEDICEFFGDKTNNSCKAVVYQKIQMTAMWLYLSVAIWKSMRPSLLIILVIRFMRLLLQKSAD